jgi:membrane fusion protein (multidrug efflux system)
MDAKVDVKNTDGRMLADAARSSTLAQTTVFEQDNSAADEEVRRIINANGGQVGRVAVAARVHGAAPGRDLAGSSVAASVAASSAASVATLAAGNVSPAVRLK